MICEVCGKEGIVFPCVHKGINSPVCISCIRKSEMVEESNKIYLVIGTINGYGIKVRATFDKEFAEETKTLKEKIEPEIEWVIMEIDLSSQEFKV